MAGFRGQRVGPIAMSDCSRVRKLGVDPVWSFVDEALLVGLPQQALGTRDVGTVRFQTLSETIPLSSHTGFGVALRLPSLLSGSLVLDWSAWFSSTSVGSYDFISVFIGQPLPDWEGFGVGWDARNLVAEFDLLYSAKTAQCASFARHGSVLLTDLGFGGLDWSLPVVVGLRVANYASSGEEVGSRMEGAVSARLSLDTVDLVG